MDKNLLMAIALSMVVLTGYYLMFPPPKNEAPPANAPAEQGQSLQNTSNVPPAVNTGQGTAAPAPGTAAGPATGVQAREVTLAKIIQVETPLYTAKFDTRGGTLVSFKLHNFEVGKESVGWVDLLPFLSSIPFLGRILSKDEVIPGELVELASPPLSGVFPFSVRFMGEDALSRQFDGMVFDSNTESITLMEGDSRQQTMILKAKDKSGLTLQKTFVFHPDSYQIDYRLNVINYGQNPRILRVAPLFGEGSAGAYAKIGFGTHLGPIWMEDDDVETEDADDLGGSLQVSKPQWMGISETYFITAVSNQSTISHGFFNSQQLGGEDGQWIAHIGMELPQTSVPSGQMVQGDFKVYLGPKSVPDLEKFGNHLDESLVLPAVGDFLKLDLLAWPMLMVLRWFHSYTGNYGYAIILLTILVRILIFPFTYKGSVNMKRMSKLKPRIDALKAKYKDDKERFSKEMMGIYKKNKINPVGGCLPLMLQMPVFLALYSALIVAIELRHAPFIFWIYDMSAMDGLFIFPVLMCISMFVQQKLMPTPDPNMAKIMVWMPVMFFAFMVTFPSGLVLYWLTSNILSIGQQLVINRIKIEEFAD